MIGSGLGPGHSRSEGFPSSNTGVTTREPGKYAEVVVKRCKLPTVVPSNVRTGVDMSMSVLAQEPEAVPPRLVLAAQPVVVLGCTDPGRPSLYGAVQRRERGPSTFAGASFKFLAGTVLDKAPGSLLSIVFTMPSICRADMGALDGVTGG